MSASASSAAGVSAGEASEPTVTLVAADGSRLTVARRTAAVSGLLRTMLASSASAEAARGEVSLPELSREALQRCIAYMEYKRAHAGGNLTTAAAWRWL